MSYGCQSADTHSTQQGTETGSGWGKARFIITAVGQPVFCCSLISCNEDRANKINKDAGGGGEESCSMKTHLKKVFQYLYRLFSKA